MEIVVSKKNNKAIVPRVVVVPNQKSQSNKSVKNKKKRQRRAAKKRLGPVRGRFVTSEATYLMGAQLAPDLYGPVRIPRSGSTRTGLGFDETFDTITGSATNLVQGVQASSQFLTSGMNSWNAVNTTTAIGGPTGVAIATQFPASSQLADVNLVGCSLTAYYIGNPLNVAGEVILGSCIPISNSATYASLYTYPGTIRIPLAQLIAEPLRVSFRKLSPISDEFVAPAIGNSDVDMPFLFTSGQTTGGALQVIVTRSWEYRSTTGAGSVIPYERVGSSFSTDIAAIEDARAMIAQMPSPITVAVSAETQQGLTSMLGLGGLGSVLGGSALAGLARQFYHNRVSSGRRSSQPSFLPGFQDSLQRNLRDEF